MKLYSSNDNYKLYQGSMLDMLEVIEPNSIDSIITDPPYELNFMSKGWDNAGVSFQPDTWKKCYEVLKPGGYLLAFGGSRTFHRIACAIEDAGFEIRDTIMWIYGSGFPKSMNIGLAIDKRNGVESIDTGITSPNARPNCDKTNTLYESGTVGKDFTIKKATNKWNGWGTALKPSFEPIIVARKPFKGSLVDNVIEWGVGGINIDECRVGNEERTIPINSNDTKKDDSIFTELHKNIQRERIETNQGRFPANTILTYDETDYDEVCGGFPDTKTGSIKPHKNKANAIVNKMTSQEITSSFSGDSGSASRYFMNCKYTGKDEEIWKQLLVSNVENNLEILKATKDSFVQISVEDLLKELKDHYAKYVDNQLDLIETPIVQDIVEMLIWDFKIGTSKVIQDFIGNYKKCIQFLNLVQFVEEMDNIDTTQTTQNLLKLFGYVKAVITNYIQGNIEFDQRRYIYTPKASKKDRDEGCQELEDTVNACSNQAIAELKRGNDNFSDETNSTFNKVYKGKNTHPTVKPTSLMQYLVRLVSPKGATILDCFNGSGSTGKAVMYENKERDANYKYIGIELTEEYLPIAKARIEYVCGKDEEPIELKNEEIIEGQTNIFEFIGDDE